MTTEVSVSVDLNCVKEWFDHFNGMFFETELDRPTFDVDSLDTEYGYCLQEETDPRPVLGVTDIFPSQSKFYGTLLHEMIHLYQIQILGQEPDHGASFEYWAKIMKKDEYFV